MRKKRFINIQKLFCFASFIFLLTCFLWYGGRFVYFYLENRNSDKTDTKSFATFLISKNKNLNKVDGEYYFYKDVKKNYLRYSNIEFRILKVNSNKEVVLITDKPITYLAYGTDVEYSKSPIVSWLNHSLAVSYSGVLEDNLNDGDKYLSVTESCLDDISDVNKLKCKKKNNNNISLLSINDYINSGDKDSFINNGYYTYLANDNGKGEKWIINDDGKLSTDDGSGIYGIKAVVTLKSDINFISGDGTEDNPYVIEEKNEFFGSYVKLGDDVWRVYSDDGNLLKLSLDDYLMARGEKFEYIYSNSNSFHNDTIYGTLAYYLNRTYLYNLSYGDIIKTNNYYNGYYNEQDNYNFKSAINYKADTKVANLSIGDVILNPDFDNYFLATGLYDKSEEVYLALKDGMVDTIEVNKKAYVIPCISISESVLTKGTGTKDDPYRTE